MCIVIFSPPDLHSHFLYKQLFTASANGMSASHIKAIISLITEQPRSSSGLSPHSTACIYLCAIPTLSGCSTHRICLSRSFTWVTSLALLPRSMLRAAHKYPTENVCLFARTSHCHLRVWPSPHQAAFKSYELVTKAQPISPVSEFVLVGELGLMHAILLSNQVHTLTVNMAGVVAIWDIMHVVWVGQFAWENVVYTVNAPNNTGQKGSMSHPRVLQQPTSLSPMFGTIIHQHHALCSSYDAGSTALLPPSLFSIYLAQH